MFRLEYNTLYTTLCVVVVLFYISKLRSVSGVTDLYSYT